MNGLIVKYPREFEPYQLLFYASRQDTPDHLEQLRASLVKRAQEDPDDPFALLLEGFALEHKNTAESIRLLEFAQAKAPNFPLPAKQLAGLYFWGKHGDVNRLKQNLEILLFALPEFDRQ